MSPILEFRSTRSRVCLHLVLVLLLAPFVYPFVAMLIAANGSAGLVNNVIVVATRPEVPGFFVSSVAISAGTIVLSYSTTMLAAFAIALLRHRGKTLVTYALVAALTLPGVCLIVPLVFIVSALGLFDSWLSVIVPVAALTVPFNILLTIAFMRSIPHEYFEAAAIDGASTWQIFWHIVLPLCRPISAVVVVWTFVAAWNEYLLPLIFLQDPAKSPITLLPTFFTSQYGIDQPKIVAASLIILVPSVIIFLLTQRAFERGITSGGLK